VVNRKETALDSMVIPLCCSSSLLSRYRTFPVRNHIRQSESSLLKTNRGMLGRRKTEAPEGFIIGGALPACLEEMMLLAARSESVNVVFPWSTCPQVVIFRVVCEFDCMMMEGLVVKKAVAEFVHHHLPLCQLNPHVHRYCHRR
jgi:hypothetical protein